MVNNCIYRTMKTGIKCNKKSDTLYCENHIYIKNRVYELLENILKDNTEITKKNVLQLLSHIYNNCDDLNEKEKKILFKVCIKYVCYYKQIILELVNTEHNEIINKKLKKEDILNKLHNYIYNLYIILNDSKKYNNILYIQKIWYKKLLNKVNIKYEEKSENIEDPFTYDTIDEIPEELRFSFKDSNGHIYTFNGLEFYYFINKTGKWNPYTRENITEETIDRLNKFIKYSKLNIKDIEEKYKWKTPSQAYTEISYILEKSGFYSDVNWFISLKYIDIKDTIATFHKLSRRIPSHINYFKIKINKETYVYDFCNNIQELFNNANEHYILCCNFIKALGVHNLYFYNNIPDWLNDITETNNFNRFNYYSGLYNNTSFYMVYNLQID